MAHIIFDLDGTLIDSALDIQASVNAMLIDEGQAALDLATVTSFTGHGLPKLIERVIGHCDMDMSQHARLTADVLGRYSRSTGDLTRPYAHVLDTLILLKSQGHILGICTNKPHVPAVHILRQLGLDVFFDVVVGGDSTVAKKPDPLPLQTAISQVGTDVALGDVLFVGDTDIDADTAVAVGVKFALYSEGYRKRDASEIPHDFQFADYRDLPGFVASCF